MSSNTKEVPKLQAPQIIMDFISGSLAKDLNELDFLTSIGEQPYEIEGDVGSIAKKAQHSYGVWLIHKSKELEAGIYPLVIPDFFSFIYLEEWRKKVSLKDVRKNDLLEFLKLLDFSVTQKEWNEGLTPFNAILSIYQFLDEIGYEANLDRRRRAIKQIKKELKKQPMISKEKH